MLIACVTLVAALMMIRFGLAKNAIEVRWAESRACPSCRRRHRGSVCPHCGGT